jgi:outer membrane protein assembly factor BamB
VVLLLNDKGEVINQINGLNICQNIGGNRAISISSNGRFFVVCENVADKITAYDLSTGDEMWSLPGNFQSVAMANGITYVLSSSEDNKMYKDEIIAIDSKGNIIKRSTEAKGFDISVDPNANCLWVVGADIKKYDMDMKVVKTIDPITWYAVSVDVDHEGTVWVVERLHGQVAGGQNRLLSISKECELLQSIPLNDLSPRCLRVNRSDSSVWITGKRGRYKIRLTLNKWPPWQKTYQEIGPRTQKYSSDGKLLLEIKRGGQFIDIDPSDGSVWIADRTQLLHYSSEGKRLETCDDVSGDQKWIAVK